MAGRAGHRGWGNIRKLPSGRYQSSYLGPDLVRHTAPDTFVDKDTAVVWLARERALVAAGDWSPPKIRAARRRTDTLAVYAAAWVDHRRVRGRPLKPRTKAHYRALLDHLILPTFGDISIRSITPEAVRAWRKHLDERETEGGKPTPTANAHAYALLKSILQTAVAEDRILQFNPCTDKGAGRADRASTTVIATPAQIEKLIASMPERYRLMTALAGWCGLRYGELIELRRRDIDLRRNVVRVERGAVLVDGEFVVGTTKSTAGDRTVDIPPHIQPIIRRHLDQLGATGGREALLTPAATDPTKHLRTASLHKVFTTAKAKAGLPPTFRWHDLRHSAGSNATAVGAALPEVMRLLGHSTTAAALRYQHQVDGRGAAIAAALSKLAEVDGHG